MSDDPTPVAIEPKDSLYRRILGYYVRADGTISSAAFMTRSKRPDPSVSVHLARLITPEQSLEIAGVPGLGVVEISAAVPLGLGLAVVHDPQAGDYGHCLIEGLSTKQQCAALAAACVLRLLPKPRSG